MTTVFYRYGCEVKALTSTSTGNFCKILSVKVRGSTSLGGLNDDNTPPSSFSEGKTGTRDEGGSRT